MLSKAVGAILCLDEADKMGPGQLDAILSVCEEGESIVNKYAFLVDVNTKTTGAFAANPKNGDWSDSLQVTDKNLPFPPQMLNRFDIVVIVRKLTNKQSHYDYALQLSEIDYEDESNFDYEFLSKYITVAKEIRPKATHAANRLIAEYYSEFMMDEKIEYYKSGRSAASIIRIAEAFARLRHVDEIDETIAQRVIDFDSEKNARLNITIEHKTEDSIYLIDVILGIIDFLIDFQMISYHFHAQDFVAL